MKRIFITGGHYTPAKAVIDQLSEWQVFYVGRRQAMEGDDALALEYQELSRLGNLRYLSITTGRLQRKFFVNVGQSLAALAKIPVGFWQSFGYLVKYHPKIVLSFGGYVAVPVVVGAWLLDIPVVTHEQTQTVGLANKIIRLFGAKVLETGNPLRKEILEAKPTLTNTIFITGGNQGSHTINLVVEEVVDRLAKKCFVVHQTGDSSFEDFKRLSRKQNPKYRVVKFLEAGEMAKTLARAKIIVSRAGANIVTEIAYLGKPAILIPLPWSGGGEQEKNAQKLAQTGLAEIILQKDLTGEKLLETVNKIDMSYKTYMSYMTEARKLVSPNAAEKIVEEIKKLT